MASPERAPTVEVGPPAVRASADRQRSRGVKYRVRSGQYPVRNARCDMPGAECLGSSAHDRPGCAGRRVLWQFGFRTIAPVRRGGGAGGGTAGGRWVPIGPIALHEHVWRFLEESETFAGGGDEQVWQSGGPECPRGMRGTRHAAPSLTLRASHSDPTGRVARR